jgi:hypothetical protein
MNHNHILQCKRVIVNNPKTTKHIKLTLADKMALYVLSKRLKKENNMESITFEEFVLLCKHHKIKANLRIESKYSTSFIDVLSFNSHTIYNLIVKLVKDIEIHNDEFNYNDLEYIRHYITINNIILFDCFVDICKKLKVKISIE